MVEQTEPVRDVERVMIGDADDAGSEHDVPGAGRATAMKISGDEIISHPDE